MKPRSSPSSTATLPCSHSSASRSTWERLRRGAFERLWARAGSRRPPVARRTSNGRVGRIEPLHSFGIARGIELPRCLRPIAHARSVSLAPEARLAAAPIASRVAFSAASRSAPPAWGADASDETRAGTCRAQDEAKPRDRARRSRPGRRKGDSARSYRRASLPPTRANSSCATRAAPRPRSTPARCSRAACTAARRRRSR